MLEVVANRYPGVCIVLGGPHCTLRPDQVLADTRRENTFVVRGEGEGTIVALLNSLNAGQDLSELSGISWWQDGSPHHAGPVGVVSDLDTLPMPARHLFPMAYYRARTGYAQLITSRGCPYRCAFCAAPAIWQGRHRVRTPQSVVSEIHMLVRRFGFRRLVFADDLFMLSRRRVHDLCDAILSSGIQFEWWCTGRTNVATEDVIDKMAKAGCVQIFYGIESANQSTLDLVRKRTTPAQARAAVRRTKQHGIRVTCSFIIGLPGETRADVLRTIRFVKALEPDVVDLNFLKPYPGSELAENREKYGLTLLTDDPWRELSSRDPILGYPVMETPLLKKRDLVELYLCALEELRVLRHCRQRVEGF